MLTTSAVYLNRRRQILQYDRLLMEVNTEQYLLPEQNRRDAVYSPTVSHSELLRGVNYLHEVKHVILQSNHRHIHFIGALIYAL